MENPEEVLAYLEEFSKLNSSHIPRELEEYLCFVAKTGDPVYQWSIIKTLFRQKLINVITEFYEACPSVEIPPCPNVDLFNYDRMKNFILEKLDTFAAAPFTVQRICELLTTPRKEYNRIDKYMRALEKNILVVSTREPGNRRATENGESIVNGIESEHAMETSNSDINVEVEMDESPSPSWPTKSSSTTASSTTATTETTTSSSSYFPSNSSSQSNSSPKIVIAALPLHCLTPAADPQSSSAILADQQQQQQQKLLNTNTTTVTMTSGDTTVAAVTSDSKTAPQPPPEEPYVSIEPVIVMPSQNPAPMPIRESEIIVTITPDPVVKAKPIVETTTDMQTDTVTNSEVTEAETTSTTATPPTSLAAAVTEAPTISVEINPVITSESKEQSENVLDSTTSTTTTDAQISQQQQQKIEDEDDDSSASEISSSCSSSSSLSNNVEDSSSPPEDHQKIEEVSKNDDSDAASGLEVPSSSAESVVVAEPNQWSGDNSKEELMSNSKALCSSAEVVETTSDAMPEATGSDAMSNEIMSPAVSEHDKVSQEETETVISSSDEVVSEADTNDDDTDSTDAVMQQAHESVATEPTNKNADCTSIASETDEPEAMSMAEAEAMSMAEAEATPAPSSDSRPEETMMAAEQSNKVETDAAAVVVVAAAEEAPKPKQQQTGDEEEETKMDDETEATATAAPTEAETLTAMDVDEQPPDAQQVSASE